MTGGDVMPVGSIIETAARVAVVFAIVCFAVFAHALWTPKATSAGQASNEHRVRQPACAQKKKGKNSKKKQKARGGASAKTAPSNVCALSEEELEVAKEQSASDVEAPSMPSRRETDSTYDSDAPSDCALTTTQIHSCVSDAADDEDLEMCALVSIEVAGAISESGSACEDTRELVEKDPPVTSEVDSTADKEIKEANCPGEMRSAPDALGCPVECIYTKSLLLMHCGMQKRIAKGAPGLEPPSAVVSAEMHRIRSVHVSS